MRRRKESDEEESEATGTDLDQMIAMLEKAEVDYTKEDSDDGEIRINVGEDEGSSFYFSEDGDLLRVS